MKISIAIVACSAAISFYAICCTVFNRDIPDDLGERIRVAHIQRNEIVDVTQEIQRERRKEIVGGQGLQFNRLDSADWATGSFPEEKWQRIDPAVAGWNVSGLKLAKEYFEWLNADACVIIQKGYVVEAWGEISKPIDARSLRKSFLNTLIGIYVDNGTIRLDESLASLGIDEKTPLTDVEKNATVAQLLESRSGIYLPSAYDPNDHPQRGLYKPGEIWHYNNWDFNALGTVFEKKTGKKIFESFDKEIATQLKMQDFNLKNTKYLFEDVSMHPAYLFETSARDDARMGLLWLNRGKWKGKQIVSCAWMDESTALRTDFKGKGGLSLRDGYGFLFWIDKDKEDNVVGFAALGNSGQYIYVNSKYDLVIVLRADPGSIFKKWFGMRLDPKESYGLVDVILDAAPE